MIVVCVGMVSAPSASNVHTFPSLFMKKDDNKLAKNIFQKLVKGVSFLNFEHRLRNLKNTKLLHGKQNVNDRNVFYRLLFP